MSEPMPQSPDGQGGFTIIEVMIALVILAVGVLALLGASGMVTRMIGAGRHSTAAVEVATQRLESLRRIAHSSTPPCTHADFSSGTAAGQGYTEAWTVSVTGQLGTVADTVTYATTRGNRTVGLETRVLCR